MGETEKTSVCTSEWVRAKGRHCDKCSGDILWLYIRRHYCNPGQRITCHIMARNKFIQLRKFISGHVSKLVPTMHFWHRIISLSALGRPLILMLFASQSAMVSVYKMYGIWYTMTVHIAPMCDTFRIPCYSTCSVAPRLCVRTFGTCVTISLSFVQ